MKFVHIADMHFGAPFTSLGTRSNLASKRKEEQKEVFKKVIQYIKENGIEHFFISGDLYEQENVNIGIIEFCNNLFKEIPETKIWIAPGNHDPYIANSYYQTYNWAENVTIFKNQIECFETDQCNIYGYGFGDFYEKESGVENIKLNNEYKLNILVVHGELDMSKNAEKPYNPMSSSALKSIGFDYIALGHIHNTNFAKFSRIIYPGSTICMGFDELGNHGMVVRRNR